MEFVIQNLKDAGCSAQCIKRFLFLEREEEKQEQLKLLATHRRQLLKKVHEVEQQINCLDYLVYRLEKEKKYQ